MAAVLERSFIEICGFERETLQRFREVIVNLGKPSRGLFSYVSFALTFTHLCVSAKANCGDMLTTASTATTLVNVSLSEPGPV